MNAEKKALRWAIVYFAALFVIVYIGGCIFG